MIPLITNLAEGASSIPRVIFQTVRDSSSGLEVRFDGKKTMNVLVGTDKKDTMCGLCGNYNGAKDDAIVGPSTKCSMEIYPEPGTTVNHFY